MLMDNHLITQKIMNTSILREHKANSGVRYVRNIFVILISIIQTSCTKLVEIPAPANSMSSANVFTNDESAIAVLTGIYTDMSKPTNSGTGGFAGINGISALVGLSSDELTYHDGLLGSNRYIAYYTNNLAAVGPAAVGFDHWASLYAYIFRCNSAIEGLNAPVAAVLTPAIRQQLLGEAKFLRAFFYFYLTNMFGDIPLAVSTDYKVNTLLVKKTASQIYQQIIADLQDAKALLADGYLGSNLLQSTAERVRPTKWAAIALLARTYLYQEDYQHAEAEASALIDNVTQYELLPLNNVFLKNSKEGIWQLQPTTVYFNTEEGRLFIIPASGPNTSNPVYLSEQLLNEFEPGDQRAINGNWIDSTIYKVTSTVADTVFYPNKYKKNLLDSAIAGSTSIQKMTEYQMVLRIGEQYLIRAEARAQQNKIPEAKADLDVIRQRAGLETTTASDQSSLLDAILHERFVELFSEWGHRWFDLKRMGKIDAVMTIVTPLKSSGLTSWQSYQQLYPIPQEDIDKAPNLLQNTGY